MIPRPVTEGLATLIKLIRCVGCYIHKVLCCLALIGNSTAIDEKGGASAVTVRSRQLSAVALLPQVPSVTPAVTPSYPSGCRRRSQLTDVDGEGEAGDTRMMVGGKAVLVSTGRIP